MTQVDTTFVRLDLSISGHNRQVFFCKHLFIIEKYGGSWSKSGTTKRRLGVSVSFLHLLELIMTQAVGLLLIRRKWKQSNMKSEYK